MFGNRHPLDGFLAFENGFSIQDRLEFRFEGRGCAFYDLPFLVTTRVIDDDLEKKTVALGFGQVVGAFLLDWVLGGENEKGSSK